MGGWQPFKKPFGDKPLGISVQPLVAVKNILNIPGDILKGDVKGALGLALNPLAKTQETRDRTVATFTGAVKGAVTGFIASGGNPIAAAGAAAGGGFSAEKAYTAAKRAVNQAANAVLKPLGLDTLSAPNKGLIMAAIAGLVIIGFLFFTRRR